jgi:hypothetical protein
MRFDENDEPEEQNPEWDTWRDNSGLEDKIREMGEWQMAGADVYMSSFAQLKHYPFFHRMSNWFRPFDIHHPELESIRQELEEVRITPLHLIAHSPYFCNSDKYSFALSISSLPKAMQEATIQQMEQQAMAEEGSLDKMRNLIEMKPQKEDISRQYLQDLYRFFKLWRGHYEEEDIFQWHFRLWEVSHLHACLMNDIEQVKQIGNYLIQKEYYMDAYDIYQRLAEQGITTAEIFQKLGYIVQTQKNYKSAIALGDECNVVLMSFGQRRITVNVLFSIDAVEIRFRINGLETECLLDVAIIGGQTFAKVIGGLKTRTILGHCPTTTLCGY